MIASLRPPDRVKSAAVAAVIAAAALAAYCHTFRMPFLFDDGPAILENPGIRRLWPLWSALWPQSKVSTVSGRPVANFTVALNYALSGTHVWSYHALNLLIHVLGGLTLYGVVRRTLLQPVLQARFGRDARPLALAVALLWTLHPLQTEAVTYIIQRVESLMGLLYLLTVYGFIRAAAAPRPWRWQVGTVAACLLGMATKEVMVTAPVLVLLYDRTFVAGTFREAWRRRGRLHLCLVATWLLLLGLVASTGWNRGGASGFNVGVTPSAYWLTQFEAVARYLWLAAWPHPLVFDYGSFWVQRTGEVVGYALVVVPLVAAAVWALWRAPAAGFLGAWFFGILAVTSVVPGTIQMIVEHRMYLPVAAVIAPAVLGLHAATGRRCWVVFAALALGLGLLTARRNEDYRSETAIWSDTVAKRPDSPRARNGLAFALDHAGRIPEAVQQFEAALRLAPDAAELHDNLGVTLARAGRTAEAIEQFEAALRLQPDFPVAHSNLGNALLQAGRAADAIRQYEAAVRLKPDYAEAEFNLGGVLDQMGQTAEALRHYEAAARLRPDFAPAHYNLGDLLSRLGRTSEAMAQYEDSLRLQPDLVPAHDRLGELLCRSGRTAEGLAHLNEAVRLRPDYVRAHFNLGVVLMQAGRTPEAIEQYGEALRLQPDLMEAHTNLAMVLAQSGRLSEAIAELHAALRLSPDSVEAHFNLGSALLQSGRTEEAIVQYQEVLRLRPDDATARQLLDMIRAGRPAGRSTP
jgi:tetratricopeptide (TPR) repeat protein